MALIFCLNLLKCNTWVLEDSRLDDASLLVVDGTLPAHAVDEAGSATQAVITPTGLPLIEIAAKPTAIGYRSDDDNSLRATIEPERFFNQGTIAAFGNEMKSEHIALSGDTETEKAVDSTLLLMVEVVERRRPRGSAGDASSAERTCSGSPSESEPWSKNPLAAYLDYDLKKNRPIALWDYGKSNLYVFTVYTKKEHDYLIKEGHGYTFESNRIVSVSRRECAPIGSPVTSGKGCRV